MEIHPLSVRVRAAVLDSGVRPQEIANKSGVGYATVWDFVCAVEWRCPTVDNLEKIAEAVGLEISVGGEGLVVRDASGRLQRIAEVAPDPAA